MAEIADEFMQGNIRVQLFYQPHPENPRTEWDNVGVMALDVGHRYNLGDSTDDDTVRAVRHAAEHFGNGPGLNRKVELYLKLFHGATVVLPVYAYIHSGITISVGQAFSDPWDSGLAGWTFDTAERREAMGTDPLQVEMALRDEAKTYNQYLTGDVYGYVVERVALDDNGDPDEATAEELEACWGYYGHTYAVEEAKRVLATWADDSSENYDPVKRKRDLISTIPHSDYPED